MDGVSCTIRKLPDKGHNFRLNMEAGNSKLQVTALNPLQLRLYADKLVNSKNVDWFYEIRNEIT